MTRQPLQARLVLVAALGLTAAACGLDRQGTEFTALEREGRLDGGVAAAQGRADGGAAGEAPDGAAHSVGIAGLDAARQALAPEATSSQVAEPSEDLGATLDASPDAAAAADAALAADAAPSEAAPPASVGTSCDQDGDGHMAAGLPCFGDDCCDSDPDVHPGQTAYFTAPGRCGGFDYDCDGTAAPQYGVTSCQWTGLGCTGDGFVDSTACGVAAAFTICASPALLTCVGSVGSLTQACR